MSFYDDASLVFLPSGGAGKDGKAYSMKPIPEYGSELVTNGGFDTDTDWVKGAGWTISGGTANSDGSQGLVSDILRQSNAVPLNTKLYVSIEVSNYVSGALQVKFAPVGYPLNVTKNGIYTIVTNGDNSLNTDLQIVSTAFIGSIDNVSVREVVVGDGDFTFSRGSNLTATRVDSNGLIEKGRENLLLQSNQFDTTWTTTSASVTGGQTGYDGSSDAWLLESDSDGASRSVRQTTTASGVHTFSVYAKAGSVNHIALYAFGANSGRFFDLNPSTTGSRIGSRFVSTPIDSKIEDIGGGWFRCSIVVDWSSSGAWIYPIATDGTSITTAGDNIYIQDAQLEQGLVATEYIESGASTGKAGLLENSPRFDYSGGASCPSLLLEPSRTQLAKLSEYFEGWSNLVNITPTTNYTTSPEGLQNATRLQFTSNGYMYNTGAPTQVSGTEYTLTLYAKRNDSGTQSFGFFTNGSGSVDSAMALTSEWQRFTYTYTASNNSQLGLAGLSGADVSVYSFQAEQGSYPTSYIPNHSGGSVTREADITSVTSVSDLIGQTEGTIYCEFEYNGAADSGVFNRIIGLGTGVTQNRILLAKNDTTAELVAFAVTGGTTQVFQAIATTSIIGRHKVAMSYKANEYKVYLDGQLKFTDSSASVPATTDVYIGTAEDGTTNNELGGIVKQSIIFKEVLSEDNCKALTTL